MSTLQDSFISYGRADSKEFAAKLKEQLAIAGYRAWFDFDDIPLATDFQERIDDGIEKSHNFLYVISPSSVNSVYCDKELQRALECGKRIIPIMHVEEISRETWKSRNPECTEADWETFQASGKHNSWDNLHETARKLNWVHFREDIDDFEVSLQGLIALFEQHQDCVQQHTQLLSQALKWEREHKQTRYLLVGKERQTAEAWLQQQFAEGTAPCDPSLLHCEFITESVKNAHNLMTQVFLCHSSRDQEVANTIRQSLMRQGITVWNYSTDIQGSENYHQAIARGIEAADNFLFVLSPNSTRSSYCCKELEQARALHKRIIPIFVSSVAYFRLPKALKELQHVDLEAHLDSMEERSRGSQLIKLLKEEETYYNEHKIWLTQALKWERQDYNPALLLRGYNLKQAEAWLKLARNHCHAPTELQEQFIEESLKQPPSPSLDVFISYSRVDSDFSRRLNEALQIQGKETWFDQESIATGTDFQREIYRGIESSDVFLFVLSPESVRSPYCADEVEYAQKLNKRIVTVLHRSVDSANLHSVLAKIQWLDFRPEEVEFQTNFQALLRVLDTDREHLEEHTRLLLRAIEWERRGRSESLLLREEELNAAESWLSMNSDTEPKPTGLQQEYVRAGEARRVAETMAAQKLKRGAKIGLGAAVTGVLMALGVFAFANISLSKARAQAEEAHQLLNFAQLSYRLEQTGIQAFNQHSFRQVKSLLKAMKATQELEETVGKRDLDDWSDYPAVVPILAMQQIKMKAALSPHLFAHKAGVVEASFSPDSQKIITFSAEGRVIVWDIGTQKVKSLESDEDSLLAAAFRQDSQIITTASQDGKIHAWDTKTGQTKLLLNVNEKRIIISPDGQNAIAISEEGTAHLWNLKTSQSMLIGTHKVRIYELTFSPDSQKVVTKSDDRAIRIWDVKTGKLELLIEETFSAEFSPDSRNVVTISAERSVHIWNLETGESKLLEGHEGEDKIVDARYGSDAQSILTSSWDGEIRLWNLETGKSKLLEGHEQGLSSVAFSPDGQRMLTSSWDGEIRLWNLETGKSKLLEGHEQGLSSVAFSPDGQRMLTSSWDGTVRLWDWEAAELEKGDENLIQDAIMSPDGRKVLTASEDGTVHLWDMSTGVSEALEAAEKWMIPPEFSSDSQKLISASENGVVYIWDIETGQSQLLEGHESRILSATFSPDGKRVVTGSEDGIVNIWNVKRGKSKVLGNHEAGVSNVSFSPDGKRVLTGSWDGIVHLWDVETGKSKALDNHAAGVSNVAFSPDGKRVFTSSWDGVSHVWDSETGESKVSDNHEAKIDQATFSSDSQSILAVTQDGAVSIWNVGTGELRILEGHEARVLVATFSPDGHKIVTTSEDKMVRILDLNGRPLATFDGVFGGFISDGKEVVVVAKNKVKTYGLETPNELIAWGCRWLDNYLKYGPATDSDRAICAPSTTDQNEIEPTRQANNKRHITRLSKSAPL